MLVLRLLVFEIEIEGKLVTGRLLIGEETVVFAA